LALNQRGAFPKRAFFSDHGLKRLGSDDRSQRNFRNLCTFCINVPLALVSGIVLGLYQVKGSSTDGALGWAPDFPAEAAAQAVSNFVEQHAPRQRKAAGKRLLDGLEEQVPEWMEMLDRVVQRS